MLPTLPDGRFTLVYLDPPFNTGRAQARQATSHVRVPPTDDAGAAASGTITGFAGKQYRRVRGDLLRYDDRFEDYWGFLEPRLAEAWRVLADDGTLYLHLDYREAHYAKVLLDALFGRECFLNEIVWAYDYGAKAKRRWPTKHDTILVYVKDPDRVLVRLDRRRPRAVHGARARDAREGRARQAADRRVVAHDRVADRAREDGVPDAEARGDPAPHRAGVDARGRLGARLLRGLGHDGRGRRDARPALRARRREPRGDRGHARAVRGHRGRRVPGRGVRRAAVPG